ncbi:MAG: hypothetical protein ACREJN_16500 [Nitrospiraceae bacterium]
MVFTSKFIGVLAGGCLLCLALSNCQSDSGYSRNSSSTTDEMKMDQSDRKTLESPRTTSIQGEVLRVEGHNYVVRENDGKEVRLHVDATTKITGEISQGYNIEAQVDDRSHALTMRSTPTTDRRNEKSESMLAQ